MEKKNFDAETLNISELLDRAEALLGPKEPDTRNKEEILKGWKEKMLLAEELIKTGDAIIGEHTAEGDRALMDIYQSMMKNSDWLNTEEMLRVLKSYDRLCKRMEQRRKQDAAETDSWSPYEKRYDELNKLKEALERVNALSDEEKEAKERELEHVNEQIDRLVEEALGHKITYIGGEDGKGGMPVY